MVRINSSHFVINEVNTGVNMIVSRLEKKNFRVEEKMIAKGYARYLLPTVISLCFSQLAPLVDSLCISETLGETALSAMSTVNPVYYFFNIIASFGGVGGGIGIAKAMGSGDKYTGGRVFTKAIIWMTSITAILSIIALIFIDPLLKILCATEGNFGYAKDYLRILLMGMVFYVYVFAMTCILTDDNDANLAMAGGIVTGAVNMIIDVVGMFVMHQGIWVAAFGTVMGMVAASLVFLFHARKKDRICRFTRKRKGLDDISLISIISPGTPEAAQNLLFVIQILQSNYILSSSIGVSGLGNSAVIENLGLVAYIIIAGVSESVLPLFASYYGEGNKDVNRIVKRTVLILGEVLITVFSVSLMIYPQWMMNLFSIDEPLMMETLPRAIRITAVAQIVALVNAVFVSYLQSTDEEKKATVSFFIQGIVQITVMVALSVRYPLDAPWIATLVAYVSVLLYFVFYCRQLADLKYRGKCNIVFMECGDSSDTNLKKWQEEAGEHLTEDEKKTLREQIFAPFIAAKGEYSYMCSFLMLEKDDGHRSVILRYDSRKDIMGNDEGNGEDEELVFEKCINSEFNYVRRLMINYR